MSRDVFKMFNQMIKKDKELNDIVDNISTVNIDSLSYKDWIKKILREIKETGYIRKSLKDYENRIKDQKNVYEFSPDIPIDECMLEVRQCNNEMSCFSSVNFQVLNVLGNIRKNNVLEPGDLIGIIDKHHLHWGDTLLTDIVNLEEIISNSTFVDTMSTREYKKYNSEYLNNKNMTPNQIIDLTSNNLPSSNLSTLARAGIRFK